MILQERHSPQARVFMYIKDPVYGGNNRKFVELLGFKQVTTNLTMTGTGAATITFPNYKGCLIRYVSDMDVKTTETSGKGKETYNEYAKEFMSKLCKDNTETYFRNLWNDTVVTRVNTTTELASNSVSDFLSNGRTRGDVADPPYNSADDVLKNKLYFKQDPCVYAVPFVDLFDPIFVDYIGQDGFWYAGFTGVVTSVNENYPKTGEQSLTIQCSDSNVLLDNSTLIVSWFNLPKQEESITNFVHAAEAEINSEKAAAFQNIFNTYDKVVNIIQDVIKKSQDLWIFPNDKDIGVKGLYIDPISQEYRGISARRGCVDFANGDVSELTPDLFTSPHVLTETAYISSSPKLASKEEEHDVRENTTFLEAYTSPKGRGCRKILIDPLLKTFDNLFLEKLLAGNLSLFNDVLKSPNDIINELTSRMIAYKYFDAHGNLIIELAKPNNYPNLIEYGGRSVVTAIRHLEWVERMSVKPDHVVTMKSLKDGVDYDWLALYFHGKNYILSQDDFIGFTSQYAESPLVTVVATDLSYSWDINVGNIRPAIKSLHAVAMADFNLMSKLGIKRYQTQSLYDAIWPSEQVGAKVLAQQSLAVLERVNSLADSGTIQLNHRPELQLGRTIINPLRMKSYLITGITNSWSPGGIHTTTLTLTYGRPLHKTLETPWHSIFAEPDVFGFEMINKEAQTYVDFEKIFKHGIEPVVGVDSDADPKNFRSIG